MIMSILYLQDFSIPTVSFYIVLSRKTFITNIQRDDTVRKLIEVTKSANRKQCTQFPCQSTSRRWEETTKKEKIGEKIK